jgi:hypothetical protein
MTTLDRDLASEEDLPDSELDPYAALLARLSHQSVVKHFDAYADVDWDAPELALDAGDPRWELSSDDTLGATSWYRALPQGGACSSWAGSGGLEDEDRAGVRERAETRATRVRGDVAQRLAGVSLRLP